MRPPVSSSWSTSATRVPGSSSCSTSIPGPGAGTALARGRGSTSPTLCGSWCTESPCRRCTEQAGVKWEASRSGPRWARQRAVPRSARGAQLRPRRGSAGRGDLRGRRSSPGLVEVPRWSSSSAQGSLVATASEAAQLIETPLLVLSPEDERWLDFVSGHPEALPFHHPSWTRVLSESYGYRSFVLAVSDEGGTSTRECPWWRSGSVSAPRGGFPCPLPTSVHRWRTTGS